MEQACAAGAKLKVNNSSIPRPWSASSAFYISLFVQWIPVLRLPRIPLFIPCLTLVFVTLHPHTHTCARVCIYLEKFRCSVIFFSLTASFRGRFNIALQHIYGGEGVLYYNDVIQC